MADAFTDYAYYGSRNMARNVGSVSQAGIIDDFFWLLTTFNLWENISFRFRDGTHFFLSQIMSSDLFVVEYHKLA